MDELIELFPTPVLLWKYNESIVDETKLVEDLEYMANGSSDNALGNTKSKDSFVLEKNELKSIRDFVQKCLDEYAVRVLATDQKLYITQSWCNKNKKGSKHHEHTHTNSLVSGVFYFKTNKSAPINFHKNTITQMELNPIKYNHVNSNIFNMEVKSSELVLFPSTLKHSVPVNKDENDRISLSFNTFSKGVFGDENKLNYLNVGDK